MILLIVIPSLMTNAGDRQGVDVAIHENACFSERAAVA